MRKKWLLLLIPALGLLAGFLYLRFSMQRAIRTEEQQTTEVLPTTDTLGGEKVSKADLRPLFIKRMQLLLRHSTNDLYDLSVGDLKVDVLASTVSLQQVAMRPNAQTLEKLKQTGQLPSAVYTIVLKKLVIEGINLDDAVTSKTMDYKLIKIVDPVIEIDQYKTNEKKPGTTGTFSQRFLQQMQMLDIKKLEVEGGTVITYKKGKKDMRLNDVQVNLADILIDSTTRTDQQRFLFAKTALISIQNYRTQTKDGLYVMKAGTITIKAPQQQVVLQNFSFDSPLSNEQFTRRQRFSKELYRLRLASVKINNVNWWAMLNKEEVVADEVETGKGKLSVHFDRSLPARSRVGNFPSQMLMKLPVKLDIAKLRMHNLDLSYKEFNPHSQQSGTVYFDNVAMNISNLSNRNRKPVVASGTALMMHYVPIQARFRFNMAHYKSGAFTAQISSNHTFQADLFNSVSMPLGLVKIKEGTLQKIQTSITGNQWHAGGDVLLLYKDLKLDMLEKDKEGLDKKDVTTFFANAFVLKKDNPKAGAEPRHETATFDRIPEAGFFSLIWKTILTGTLKTIGAPTKIASKTSNGPAQK